MVTPFLIVTWLDQVNVPAGIVIVSPALALSWHACTLAADPSELQTEAPQRGAQTPIKTKTKRKRTIPDTLIMAAYRSWRFAAAVTGIRVDSHRK